MSFTARNRDAWKTFAPELLGPHITAEPADGAAEFRPEGYRRPIVNEAGKLPSSSLA